MPKVVNIPKNVQVCTALRRNPKHLTGVAREKWNELMVVLDPSVCTTRQTDAITQYCECWATYRQAIDALQNEPMVVINEKTGAQQYSAWAKLAIEMRKALFSLGLKLGLVPDGKDVPSKNAVKSRSKFEGLLG